MDLSHGGEEKLLFNKPRKTEPRPRFMLQSESAVASLQGGQCPEAEQLCRVL